MCPVCVQCTVRVRACMCVCHDASLRSEDRQPLSRCSTAVPSCCFAITAAAHADSSSVSQVSARSLFSPFGIAFCQHAHTLQLLLSSQCPASTSLTPYLTRTPTGTAQPRRIGATECEGEALGEAKSCRVSRRVPPYRLSSRKTSARSCPCQQTNVLYRRTT